MKENNNKEQNKLNENNELNKENSNNKIKNFDKIKEDYEFFLEKNENSKKDYNLKNIFKPIIKLIIVLIISLLIVNHFNDKMGDYKYIQGSWIDENNNYYEINNKNFQMNAGEKDNPFYEGNIVNIIKNEDTITILIKGIKYKINDEITEDSNKKFIYDKDMELIFKIKNYTEDLKEPMIGNLGTNDFNIIRISTKNNK